MTDERQRLLFLHGGPGMTCDYLRPWFSPLNAFYDLVYYDQKGEHLTALHSQLSEEISKAAPCSIIAHSWGAHLLLSALKAGAAGKREISSVVLIAPMALTEERSKENMDAVRKRLSDEDAQAADAYKDLYDDESAGRFLDIVTPYYHYDRNFYLGATPYFDKKTCHAINGAIKGFDLRDSVPLLPVKTMIIYGQSDFSQPESEYPKTVSAVVVEKAGHYVFAEQNRTVLNCIRDFLKR